ncbi:MAG: NAD(P)H-dependent oxidoreductase, partial [Elusimicrobia bacterium]|nr:NAD(P)H-dependent oxidoreductase [Elusimicrobiota bacterium]
WEKEPGVCVLKDDMGGQLRKVAASDLAVFATPLYIDNVSGMTKVFMDRLTPLVDPTIFRDEAGECFHRTRLPKNPRLGVISSCGFPEQRHFDVLKLLFRRVARNLDSELAFEIYRDAGPVMAVAPFLLKDAFGRYRDLLREAGARVVRDGAISQETAAALAEPLLPPDRYVESSNARFQRLLSKLKDTGAA